MIFNRSIDQGRQNQASIVVFGKGISFNPHDGSTLTGLAGGLSCKGQYGGEAKLKKQLKTAWKMKNVPIMLSFF